MLITMTKRLLSLSGLLSRLSRFYNNLINPACGTFQHKARRLATAFHSSLTGQNDLMQFGKQSEFSESGPGSKVVLIFTKSNQNGRLSREWIQNVLVWPKSIQSPRNCGPMDSEL